MTTDNHYVPRLILRRFDERISTYNLSTKEVKISSSFKNTFSSNFLYSQEIEDLFSQTIENEFAQLLDKKIRFNENEVTLTRLELDTTKKFLLLAMIRTIDSEAFMQYRKEDTAEFIKETLNFEEKNTENLSNFDYWMRTMKCVLESTNLEKVKEHPEATLQAVNWATALNCGYISIWDSSNTGEDFVIIDNGMTSEHEPTRFFPPINDDVLKRGYLLEQIISANQNNENQKTNNLASYLNILSANDFMSENFYLFSITKNRMIVLINPFFRLYDKSDYESTNILPIPDIWPTRINDKTLFLKNKNEYVNDIEQIAKGKTDINDLYIYPIRKMNIEDVIYVNCLCLDRVNNFLGFSESSRIKKSLSTYSIVQGLNDYESLIDYFEQLGNPIIVNNQANQIKEHISPNIIQFNTREKKYIDNFLKIKKI